MKLKYEKALIVGAGIGGLSAAIALRKAGCAVDVIERDSEWVRSGIGIIQPANALRALDVLGVAQACLDAGFAYDRYDYFDAQGKLLSSVPGPRVVDHLPAYNGIVRGALHQILRDAALAHGAILQLGRTLKDLRQDAEGIEVRTSAGACARYDLVVAAEGINSPLRGRLLGGNYTPEPTGQSVWRVTMPRPADVVAGVMMSGAQYKAGYIPISSELMYLLLVTQEPAGKYFAREALHQALHERLAGFGGLVERTRHFITPDADIVYRPMEVVMLPAPWTQGRVVFIGDAAHASTPHLGQGAAMAIEDAAVLGELVATGMEPTLLGERYTERRYERATFIQSASMAIGEYEQGKRPGLNLFGLLSDAKARAAQPI